MNEQPSKTIECIIGAGKHSTQQAVNLTPKQAAARLGLSEQTLANWRAARKGNGPNYRKFGSAIRYSIEDLEAFEKNSTISMN